LLEVRDLNPTRLFTRRKLIQLEENQIEVDIALAYTPKRRLVLLLCCSGLGLGLFGLGGLSVVVLDEIILLGIDLGDIALDFSHPVGLKVAVMDEDCG
jgi:hypothetical protein